MLHKRLPCRLVRTVVVQSLHTNWWALLVLLALALCPLQVFTQCYPQHCGNVTIQYPFSITESCGLRSEPDYFQLNSTPNSSLGLGNFTYLSTGNGSYQVLDISNDTLILNITDSKASLVPTPFNATSPQTCNLTANQGGNASFQLPPYPAPFAISGDNSFVSFNCTVAKFFTDINLFTDYADYSEIADSTVQVGGCVSSCDRDHFSADCRNRACCVAPIPEDVRSLFYEVRPYQNNSACAGYAIPFYKDNHTDLETTFAFKLLWALPYSKSNSTDEIKSDPLYACSRRNSNLTYQSAVPGYVCVCLPGFAGDGYLNGTGCTDINECKVTDSNNCDPHRATCKNTEGSYTCSCKFGYVGDGTVDGCSISTVLLVLTGLTGGAVVVGTLVVLLGFAWRERKKRMNFVQNGGLQLQEYFSSTGRDTTKVFTIDELKDATQNFSQQLGAGGHGTVFKGTLKDGRIVAVKKANRSSEKDNQQFLNEMGILTQINHRHIVRLLGCCLETETPLLVYEYISNGTLSEHLQANDQASRQQMDWAKRLQIAIQTAEALGYLHSAASPPILHRDVKSDNILLDDKLDAKVADFGISRLIPEGQTYVSTVVQGTLGYLDPEYFQTLQLTDKSDVYSLGVVLTELITGLKAVDNTRDPRQANLALLFIRRLQEGSVEEIVDVRLDAEVEEEVVIKASIQQVARLAGRCLALQGKDRPSMNEVAEELRQIRSTSSRAAARKLDLDYAEEREPLLQRGDEQPLLRGAVVMNRESKSADVVSFGDSSSSMMSGGTISLGSTAAAAADVLRTGR